MPRNTSLLTDRAHFWNVLETVAIDKIPLTGHQRLRKISPLRWKSLKSTIHLLIGDIEDQTYLRCVEVSLKQGRKEDVIWSKYTVGPLGILVYLSSKREKVEDIEQFVENLREHYQYPIFSRSLWDHFRKIVSDDQEVLNALHGILCSSAIETLFHFEFLEEPYVPKKPQIVDRGNVLEKYLVEYVVLGVDEKRPLSLDDLLRSPDPRADVQRYGKQTSHYDGLMEMEMELIGELKFIFFSSSSQFVLAADEVLASAIRDVLKSKYQRATDEIAKLEKTAKVYNVILKTSET